MAEIDGGALSFKSVMDNDQMNGVIEETLRRIKGLSDGVVAGGKEMDAAFNITAGNIESAFNQLDAAGSEHRKQISSLEAEYKKLGNAAGGAYSKDVGGSGYRTDRQLAIEGEIKARKQLLVEIDDLGNKLSEEQLKFEQNKKKIEDNATSTVSLRTQIMNLKKEMASLVDLDTGKVYAGREAQYEALKTKLGNLVDLQGDINQQGKALANDERNFQGVIVGLSGLAGGFSAVTGAVSLFAGENEDLNKVMTKVQSVMAITMGLQQVAQTLNKDSAFQLVTMNSLKSWWAEIVAKATVAETAETVATTANTAAHEANVAATGESVVAETLDTAGKVANTVAAEAGTVANLTLAGAFKAVGFAIKSIPVIGWIIAGIAALATGVYALTSKQREAKKAQEEFAKSFSENIYKPIGSIEELSLKYTKLGDNIKEKEKFIQQNQKAFDELGVSINGVKDAENLLIENKDRFVLAQIAKAKALVYTQQSSDKIKELMKKQLEYDAMPDKSSTYVQTSSGTFGSTGYYVKGDNQAKKQKKKEIDELTAEIKQGYSNAAIEESNSIYNLKKGGIESVNDYKDGTIGAIEQAITAKQEALKKLSDPVKIKANIKETEKLQKQLDTLTGKKEKTPTKEKDPFTIMLDDKKKKYDEYFKWVNAGLQKEAQVEFSGLLEKGKTYKDYLQNMVDSGKLTKKQLHQVTNEIASETNTNLLDIFKDSISQQLDSSRTVIDQLVAIKKMRDELKDNDPLKKQKSESLDEAEKNVVKKSNDEYEDAGKEYSDYLDSKEKTDVLYFEKRKKLEEQFNSETDIARKKVIQQQIDTLDLKQKTSEKKAYDAMLDEYKTYEQQKVSISADYDAKIALATKNNNHELVALLTKEKVEALKSLSDSQLDIIAKNNVLLSSLFNKAGAMSKKSTQQALQNSEKLLSYLRGEKQHFDLTFITKEQADQLKESPESIIKIQEATDQLKDDLGTNDDGYLFSGVIKGFKLMQKAQDKYTQASKTDNQELKNSFNELGDKAKDSAVKSLSQGAYDALQGVQALTDAMQKLADASGDERMKENAEMMSAMGSNLQAAGEGAKSGGWIGAIVGGVTNIIQQSVDASAIEEAEQKEFEQNRLDFLNSYELLQLKVSETKDKVFGSDSTKIAIEAYQKAKKALEEYNEALEKTTAVTASYEYANAGVSVLTLSQLWAAKELSNETKTLMDSYKKGYTDLQAMAVKTKDRSGWANFWGDQDLYTSLKDLAPQLWDSSGNFDVDAAKAFLDTNTQISDEQRKQIQNVIDLKEAYDDAMAVIDEDIKDTFGSLYDSLSTALVNAVNDGTNAWSSFKNAGYDVLEDLGKKLMMELFFNSKFEALQKQLETAYDLGDPESIANAQADILAKFYESIEGSMDGAESFLEQWNKKMEDYGFTSTDSNDSSLTGAVKGVSEETASLIGGQMNAIRINQLEATEIIRSQLIYLSTIAQNTSYNVHLKDIRDDIREMKNGSGSDHLRPYGKG